MSTIDDVVEQAQRAITVLRSSAVVLRTCSLPEHAEVNEHAANALAYTIGMLTASPPPDSPLPRTSFLASLRIPGHVPTMGAVGWMVRRLILGRAAVLRVLPYAEVACPEGAEIIAVKAWIESLDAGPSGRSGEWPTTG